MERKQPRRGAGVVAFAAHPEQQMQPVIPRVPSHRALERGAGPAFLRCHHRDELHRARGDEQE